MHKPDPVDNILALRSVGVSPTVHDPIEAILARLMPPGLSDAGQSEIEAMLDELAGAPIEITPAKPNISWVRRMTAGGIAAAGVAAAMVFSLSGPPSPPPVSEAAPVSEVPAEFVLVGESDRIESMTDEGWQENSDGSAMRAVRLSVVEENSLFDEETGIVMKVSEPREEILLMPVSAF
jgi:hypothetical protein